MTDNNDKTYKVVLGAGNWSRWKLSTKAALSKTDPKAWIHIDPTAQAPVVPAQAAALREYHQREATCIDKIITTISEDNFTMVQNALENPADECPSRTAFALLQADHANVSATLVSSGMLNLQGNYFRPANGDPDAMATWLSSNDAQYNKIKAHGGNLTERDFVLALIRRTPRSADYITLATMVELAPPESADSSKQQVFRNLKSLFDRSLAQGSRSRDDGRGIALATTATPAEHPELERMKVAIALLTAQVTGKRSRGGPPKKQWRTPQEQQQLDSDIKQGICNLHRHGKCKHNNCKFRHVQPDRPQANIAYSLLTTVANIPDALDIDGDNLPSNNTSTNELDSDGESIPPLCDSSDTSDSDNKSKSDNNSESDSPGSGPGPLPLTGKANSICTTEIKASFVPRLVFSDTSEPSSDEGQARRTQDLRTSIFYGRNKFNTTAVPDSRDSADFQGKRELPSPGL
jgi:hypothetical protein